MASFTSLLGEVRRCTLCSEHLPLGPRPILQLHPRARILIAGQAPGRKVHESGVPFADASGDRLRDWLGLAPEDFYDAQAHHLPDAGASVTSVVQSWREHWPSVVPLPHPSPRNNLWLRRNPWF